MPAHNNSVNISNMLADAALLIAFRIYAFWSSIAFSRSESNIFPVGGVLLLDTLLCSRPCLYTCMLAINMIIFSHDYVVKYGVYRVAELFLHRMLLQLFRILQFLEGKHNMYDIININLLSFVLVVKAYHVAYTKLP
ncbi:hypothetical protein ACJX0J_033109 [Zea mays]